MTFSPEVLETILRMRNFCKFRTVAIPGGHRADAAAEGDGRRKLTGFRPIERDKDLFCGCKTPLFRFEADIHGGAGLQADQRFSAVPKREIGGAEHQTGQTRRVV